LVNVGYDVRGTINLYVKSCQPVSQCSYVTIGSCDRDRCCSQTPDRCFCHPGTHDAHVHLSVSQLILRCVFGEILELFNPFPGGFRRTRTAAFGAESRAFLDRTSTLLAKKLDVTRNITNCSLQLWRYLSDWPLTAHSLFVQLCWRRLL